MLTTAVIIAFVAWVPVILALFATMPARRAMITAFLGGWMFLPPYVGFALPGMPDFDKTTATVFGVLVAMAIFDPTRFFTVRPRWFDLPMIVWCLCPFASSVSNGLGAYDGVSAVFEQTARWGLAYYIGRAYLGTMEGLREAAVGLFVAGLIYMPLCLWEVRMSPTLQLQVYGYHSGGLGIEYRGALGVFGSRPNVFMGNALTVGMFMTAAAVCAVWLWRSGTVKRLGGFGSGGLALLVVLSALACKNVGALTLLAAGLAALYAARWKQTRLVFAMILVVPALYTAVRATGLWSAEPMVAAGRLIAERRAESLAFRLENEDLLTAKALQRPVFGWGRWGRARIYDEDGKDISVTDGLWVIALGNAGLLGLGSLTLSFLLPPLLWLWKCPVRLWGTPLGGPPSALAVVVALCMVDNLFNAMLNPIYMAAAGGLLGAVQADLAWRLRKPPSTRFVPANIAGRPDVTPAQP